MRRGKRPIRAHSSGWATHDGAKIPGELKVTIWGTSDRDPGREVAMVLDEEAVRGLLQHLIGGYGFRAPQ